MEGRFNGKRLVFHIKSELINDEYHIILFTQTNGNDDEFHIYEVPSRGNMKGDIIDWNNVVIPGRKNHCLEVGNMSES